MKTRTFFLVIVEMIVGYSVESDGIFDIYEE